MRSRFLRDSDQVALELRLVLLDGRVPRVVPLHLDLALPVG